MVLIVPHVKELPNEILTDERIWNAYDRCIKCGRCEDTCPQYISYINTVNTLTKVLEEEYPEFVEEVDKNEE